MRKSLLKMYHDLKESASSSDFPYLLGNTMHKKLLARFNGWPSPWRQYVLKGDLNDFRTHDRILLSEAPDLLKIEEDGNYKDAKFSDYRYQIKADTFGRTFKVTRHAIINDDLNGIMKMPQMFGRAAIRTLVKQILGLYAAGSHKCYDAKSLFHVDHSNYLATPVALANSAAGLTAVADCCNQIEAGTDPDTGELLGVRPKYLLTGTTLSKKAAALLKSSQIIPTSTGGGGTYNPVASLELLVDPLIDTQLSTTWWAVLADPADCPIVEVGFLNGLETPELLALKPNTYRVAGGGEDPYGFEFDDMDFKMRWDFGLQLAMYQGICRGKE